MLGPNHIVLDHTTLHLLLSLARENAVLRTQLSAARPTDPDVTLDPLPPKLPLDGVVNAPNNPATAIGGPLSTVPDGFTPGTEAARQEPEDRAKALGISP